MLITDFNFVVVVVDTKPFPRSRLIFVLCRCPIRFPDIRLIVERPVNPWASLLINLNSFGPMQDQMTRTAITSRCSTIPRFKEFTIVVVAHDYFFLKLNLNKNFNFCRTRHSLTKCLRILTYHNHITLLVVYVIVSFNLKKNPYFNKS